MHFVGLIIELAQMHFFNFTFTHPNIRAIEEIASFVSFPFISGFSFFFFVNFIYSGQMYENSVFSDIRDVRARTHSATMKFPYCALKSGCCSFCNGHPDFRWCWKMHFPRLRRISLYNHSNTSLQFFFFLLYFVPT